jgi:hypothetical protein
VKRRAEWGVREIVKRQIGCLGTLSAVNVDLGTVSQSHILRYFNRAYRTLRNNTGL